MTERKWRADERQGTQPAKKLQHNPHVEAHMAYRGFGLTNTPLFSLRREIDRLFDDSFSNRGGGQAWSPAIDIREDSKELDLDVELPGIDPKDVELNVENGILTVSGEKHAENKEGDEQGRYHVVERSYGSFFRSFQLPQGVDENQISADFNNGVLTIRVPKAALPQPRKIEVQSGKQQGQKQVQGGSSSGQRQSVSTGRSSTNRGQSKSEGDRMVAGQSDKDQQNQK